MLQPPLFMRSKSRPPSKLQPNKTRPHHSQILTAKTTGLQPKRFNRNNHSIPGRNFNNLARELFQSWPGPAEKSGCTSSSSPSAIPRTQQPVLSSSARVNSYHPQTQRLHKNRCGRNNYNGFGANGCVFGVVFLNICSSEGMKGSIPKSENAKQYYEAIVQRFKESEKAAKSTLLQLIDMKYDGQDNGASIYVANSLQEFTNKKLASKDEVKVFMGNGEEVQVSYTGTVRIKLEFGSVLELNEVVYVPFMKKSLISITRLVKSKFSLNLDGAGCSIFINKDLVGKTSLIDGMFRLN
ncbi:hypothetical protein GBA52_003601 [Prunus armeniaca]|nr:hypothetical protein GBA52_003601 [Prunus armeniaca]